MYTLKLTKLRDAEDQELDGVKFEIICDGQVTIISENDPDLPGFVPMTHERAREAGEIVLDRVITGDIKELERIQSQIDSLDKARPDYNQSIQFLESLKTGYIDRLFPEDLEDGDHIDTERANQYLTQLQEQADSPYIKEVAKDFIKKLIQLVESKL